MEIKMPLYNILNFFLVGMVTIGCIIMLFPEKIIAFIISDYYDKLSTVSEGILLVGICAMTYEIGLILNRAASVIIEPILIKTGIIRFVDYAIFAQKAKELPILNTLSREYALSRTSIFQFLVLTLIAICVHKWTLAGMFVACVVIFTLSCRKHAGKIVEIIEPCKEA